MVNSTLPYLSSYYPFKQKVLAHLVLLSVMGCLRSSYHSESIYQAPILGWLCAGLQLTELKAAVLALEDLLVQPGEGPRSRLQGVCSQQEVGEGNELTLPGGKEDGIPGRE